MKRILLALCSVLLFCSTAGAVTEYIVTVMPSGGNYTALETAMNTNECNLLTSIVVAGSLTRGAIADGTAVTQTTSTATAIVVSKTATQMLLKTVVGTPNNSGTWWPTTDTNDTTNAWTPTTAGDSVQFTVKIDGTWSSADTTAVVIHNYTADATRYINIYTTGDARHAGTLDTGKYRLNVAVDYTHGISTAVTYVTIDGLQIKSQNFAGSGIRLGGGSNYATVKNCIIYGCHDRGIYGYGDGGNTNHETIFNNIIYDCGNSGILASGYAWAAVNIYNNTIQNSNEGIHLVETGYGTITAKNNLAIDNASYDYNFDENVILAKNGSSDATGTAGLTGLDGANEFSNEAGDNFHLKSGATSINAGTDLSGTFTTDIDGTTRSGTWDIGADEYAASASTNSQVIIVEDK